ncbi:hypothetical protein NE237_012433 [Protea cynaroides]|uniref:Uncharacterized protein n=1 Tax=Protea cynaroides TaxID=273540 RepID=A0A9Q0GY24_9MAGN|nr:hypothetical protein NE237_012433 [Protea cynaroides]
MDNSDLREDKIGKKKLKSRGLQLTLETSHVSYFKRNATGEIVNNEIQVRQLGKIGNFSGDLFRQRVVVQIRPEKHFRPTTAGGTLPERPFPYYEFAVLIRSDALKPAAAYGFPSLFQDRRNLFSRSIAAFTRSTKLHIPVNQLRTSKCKENNMREERSTAPHLAVVEE